MHLPKSVQLCKTLSGHMLWCYEQTSLKSVPESNSSSECCFLIKSISSRHDSQSVQPGTQRALTPLPGNWRTTESQRDKAGCPGGRLSWDTVAIPAAKSYNTIHRKSNVPGGDSYHCWENARFFHLCCLKAIHGNVTSFSKFKQGPRRCVTDLHCDLFLEK